MKMAQCSPEHYSEKLAAAVPAIEIFQRSLRELGADMELQEDFCQFIQ